MISYTCRGGAAADTRHTVVKTVPFSVRSGRWACAAVRDPENDLEDGARLTGAGRRAFLLSLASLASLASLESSVKATRPAYAVESADLTEYAGSTYTISYPAGYAVSSKAGADALFTSESRRGVNIGITRLPVRIASVMEYGSVEEVGQRVLDAEKQKDGTLRVAMMGERAVSLGASEGYEYEYEVETTRGTKHIVSRVAIKDKQLYVITGTLSCGKVDACDAGFLAAELGPMKMSVDSFRFISS
ncbi:MAG: PsbP-related protein [bacterium]